MTEPDTPIEPTDDVEDAAAARRSVLRTDGMAALGAIAVGAVEGRAALLVPVIAGVTAVLCVATVVALYVVEHDAVPGLFPEVAALAALAGLAALGGGLAVVLAEPPLLVAAAALVGFGVGVLAYRIVFGVARPVPRLRLERAS